MARHWRKYEVGRYRLGSLFNKNAGRHEAVVIYRDREGKHRRRLGVFSEAQGRVALDRFVGKCEALRSRSKITFGEIWEAYRDDRSKDGKLIGAFDANWKALKHRFAALAVTDLTDDVCRDYARERLEAGRTVRKCNLLTGRTEERRLPISVGTVWSELLRLRSCLNWAAKRRVIPWAPHVWLPSKPAPRDRVLTEVEVTRLIDACVMPHIRLFVVLAITTAGRSAALLELTWDRVDFAAGTIDLRVRETLDPLLKTARKGRSIVVMTEEARSELLQAKAGARTLHVVEWDGMPIKKIRKGFEAAVQRAGLGRDVTPHVLRHTVLTWLDEDNVPMERISRLAGHRNVDTTRTIYAKPRVHTLQPAAHVIDMRLRRNRGTLAHAKQGSRSDLKAV
jgi:integrase